MLRTTLPSIFFKFIIRLSGAQYVTMQKCFSHPSLIVYVFLTPPIKIKLGLQIGGRLLIETHLDQSNTLANKQQVCQALLCLSPASANSAKCWAKTILLSQTGMVSHFFIQFIFCKGHILNTGGVALLHFVLHFQNVSHKKTRETGATQYRMVKPLLVMLGNARGEPTNIMGKAEAHSHDIIIIVWFNNFQKH